MRVCTGMERLRPPQEYEDFLVRMGGRNVFGDPNFILFWGQTRVQFGRLQDHGIPRWNLAGWKPPEEYGPPLFWDFELMGAYPSRGEYEVIQPFYQRVGKKIEHMPLNYRTLELYIPIILRHKHDSVAKRKAALLADKERKSKETEQHIADLLEDAVPAWEAASFAGQGNLNSALRQKMDQIERAYASTVAFRKRMPLGSAVN